MSTPFSGEILPRTSASSNAERARHIAWSLLIAALLISVVVYRHSWLGMIQAWSSSTTFGHGWLIIPIVGLLLWRQRGQLAQAALRPSVMGQLAVALTGLMWCLGEITQFSTLSQLAAAATPAALVLALAGPVAMRACGFALAYLLFAVPIGEELVPALMDFTATFATSGLRLVGIPVYREGLFLSIPGGDFHVAKACSGVRYLIASVALGTLYAHLMYRSTRRRLAFVALAIVIPILANGLRAMLIIVLAHLSDMQLAAGVDHLVYGWLFFGVVMGLTFWIGGRWRETQAAASPVTGAAIHPGQPLDLRKQALASALAGLLVVAAGVGAQRFPDDGTATEGIAAPLALPAVMAPWQGPYFGQHSDWQPTFPGARSSSIATYRRGSDTVQVFAAVYASQSHGRELINSENELYPRDQWRLVSATVAELATDSATAHNLNRLVVQRGVRRRVIDYWYVVDGARLRSPFAVKIASFKGLATGRPSRPAIVAVATDIDGEVQHADALLTEFVQQFVAPSTTCLVQPEMATCRARDRERGASGE